MLQREPRPETLIVRDGVAAAVIICPPLSPWSPAAQAVAEGIRRLCGAQLTVRAPEEILEHGLYLRPEYKSRALIFIGNATSNAALFELLDP